MSLFCQAFEDWLLRTENERSDGIDQSLFKDRPSLKLFDVFRSLESMDHENGKYEVGREYDR